ncbi:unnamed protein product [Cyprideis torosa]|uniref:Uncharacterized protein n=1 Tax=Cyprideis torosa TaxID=163714 RepID=A0A7R8WEE6_9CRUS|nr:unnamed protein product [Cyprideis torosa]CAG0890189.1 unnamed protein product [Cyprideis torosa]
MSVINGETRPRSRRWPEIKVVRTKSVGIDYNSARRKSVDVDYNSARGKSVDVDYNSARGKSVDVDYNSARGKSVDVDYNSARGKSVDVDYNSARGKSVDVDYNSALGKSVDVDCNSARGKVQDPVGEKAGEGPLAEFVLADDYDMELENNSVTNVTVHLGETVFLPCPIHQLGERTITWIRRPAFTILSSGPLTYTTDPRFQVIVGDEAKEWAMRIKYSKRKDRGRYECQTSGEETDTNQMSEEETEHESEVRRRNGHESDVRRRDGTRIRGQEKRRNTNQRSGEETDTNQMSEEETDTNQMSGEETEHESEEKRRNTNQRSGEETEHESEVRRRDGTRIRGQEKRRNTNQRSGEETEHESEVRRRDGTRIRGQEKRRNTNQRSGEETEHESEVRRDGSQSDVGRRDGKRMRAVTTLLLTILLAVLGTVLALVLMGVAICWTAQWRRRREAGSAQTQIKDSAGDSIVSDDTQRLEILPTPHANGGTHGVLTHGDCLKAMQKLGRNPSTHSADVACVSLATEGPVWEERERSGILLYSPRKLPPAPHFATVRPQSRLGGLASGANGPKNRRVNFALTAERQPGTLPNRFDTNASSVSQELRSLPSPPPPPLSTSHHGSLDQLLVSNLPLKRMDRMESIVRMWYSQKVIVCGNRALSWYQIPRSMGKQHEPSPIVSCQMADFLVALYTFDRLWSFISSSKGQLVPQRLEPVRHQILEVVLAVAGSEEKYPAGENRMQRDLWEKPLQSSTFDHYFHTVGSWEQFYRNLKLLVERFGAFGCSSRHTDGASGFVSNSYYWVPVTMSPETLTHLRKLQLHPCQNVTRNSNPSSETAVASLSKCHQKL